jgi:hypothetical protein
MAVNIKVRWEILEKQAHRAGMSANTQAVIERITSWAAPTLPFDGT